MKRTPGALAVGVDVADAYKTVEDVTAAAYTLVLGDANKLKRFDRATAQTLTVPPNSSVAFPIGTVIDVAQVGAGALTIAAGVGVTVNSPAGVGLVFGAQYQSGELIKTGTNLWLFRPSANGTSPTVLGHGEAQVEVVNTTAETDLCSLTVPADSLRAGDRIVLSGFFDVLNNSGGSVTYMPKLYLGTTAVLTGATGGLGASASRRRGSMDLTLVCVSASSQKAGGHFMVGGANAADMPTSVSTNVWLGSGTGAEDTTVEKVLKLTMTLGTAATTADFRLQAYRFTKFPA